MVCPIRIGRDCTGAGTEAFCSGGDQSVRGKGGYVGADGVPRLNVLDLQVGQLILLCLSRCHYWSTHIHHHTYSVKLKGVQSPASSFCLCAAYVSLSIWILNPLHAWNCTHRIHTFARFRPCMVNIATNCHFGVSLTTSTYVRGK